MTTHQKRMNPSLLPRRCLLAVLTVLALRIPLAAETVTLVPAADTFLSEFDPNNNTGRVKDIASGTVSNGTRTRTLLRFDPSAEVPQGATITSVLLEITVTRVNSGGGVASSFDLRRVRVPWNEGVKAGSNLGAQATTGETTWSRRAWPDDPWGAPGGAVGTDFSEPVSASQFISGAGKYTFASTPALVADVQAWLDDPATNFGWALLSDLEATSETARRFASREDPARSPTLVIEYSRPQSELRFTHVVLEGNQARLSWTNGTPAFQLQKRAALDSGPWTNVGSPTVEFTTAIDLTGPGAFFRIAQDFTASYQVLFEAIWSPQTHPDQYPSGSHWSGLVGGVHNDQAHFWREGETASQGIQFMAEFGSQPTLLSEVQTAINAGTALFTLSGGGINPSPGSRLLTFPQPMRKDFPLVTLCSMVAPSPDWFIGVDSLSLVEDGAWVSAKTVPLFAYDAGTDSGPSYASPNEVTVPRGVVTQITGFPARVGDAIVPFGTFTFTRLD